jgi:uncharacterized protein YoxC
MSGKKLLILERSQTNLVQNVTEDGSIILEGVFTEFGIRNKNNRIYEETETLPHINELKEKAKVGKLLGELDHPKDFDISLSNVSHVIESLEYDPVKKRVMGRIRLLNTTKGKEAQALVKDGIPLHISSRAAGSVGENGKVKIKKFFTYDLVADPGFENAELTRVNESYGFSNEDDLFIYEIQETKNTKNNIMEENTNFVKVEDFQKYTEYVKGVLSKVTESVTESANTDTTERVEQLIKYTESVVAKVNQLSDYSEYLSENLDKSISFSDYLSENVNQIKQYTGYLAEELDSNIHYSEHVAEAADNGIQYSKYLAERLDQGIQYVEHVAEGASNATTKVNQSIAYATYLSENVENGIKYADYIAEQLDQSIVHTKKIEVDLDKSIKYSEYLAENINDEASVGVASVAYVETKSYKESIEEKLNTLIEKSKFKIVTDLHFMNFLTESKKNEFKSLSIEKQDMIKESMTLNHIMSTNQAENVWDSCFIEKKREINFIQDMPEKYLTKWGSLSADRQSQIIAESKFHTVNTPYTINNFWATRDLRPSQFELVTINENKTAAEQVATVTNEQTINESFAADIIRKVKFNLGR